MDNFSRSLLASGILKSSLVQGKLEGPCELSPDEMRSSKTWVGAATSIASEVSIWREPCEGLFLEDSTSPPSRALLGFGTAWTSSLPLDLPTALDVGENLPQGADGGGIRVVSSEEEAAAASEDLSTALAGLGSEFLRVASRAYLLASRCTVKLAAISTKKKQIVSTKYKAKHKKM